MIYRRALALTPTTVARIKQARAVFCRGWRPIDAPGSRLIAIHTDGAAHR